MLHIIDVGPLILVFTMPKTTGILAPYSKVRLPFHPYELQCLLFNNKHQYQHRRSYSHLAPLASPSAFCFAHRRPAINTVQIISHHPHSPFSLLLAAPHIFNSIRFLHPPHPTIRSPLYHGPFMPRYAHPFSSCVCVICCVPLYNSQAKDI